MRRIPQILEEPEEHESIPKDEESEEPVYVHVLWLATVHHGRRGRGLEFG